MRTIFVALFLQLCLVMTTATAADPSDCEDEARKLRRAASEVEDAASSWQGVRDDADRAGQARRQAQSAAESAYQRAGRMMRACAGQTSPAVDLETALFSIKNYLRLRHGDSPETLARLRSMETTLLSLARLHVRVQASDFRMTFAVADAVYVESKGP